MEKQSDADTWERRFEKKAENDMWKLHVKITYENYKILLDPHTAVGLVCAEKLNLKKAMCLACAHPVKFQETVQKALGNNVKYDKNIEFLNDEKFAILDNNYKELGDYIEAHA